MLLAPEQVRILVPSILLGRQAVIESWISRNGRVTRISVQSAERIDSTEAVHSACRTCTGVYGAEKSRQHLKIEAHHQLRCSGNKTDVDDGCKLNHPS